MNKQFIITLFTFLFLFNLNGATKKQISPVYNSNSNKENLTSKINLFGKKKKNKSKKNNEPEAIIDSSIIKSNDQHEADHIYLSNLIKSNDSRFDIMVDSVGIFDDHKIKKDFLELRQSILNLMNFNEINSEIELIAYLYDVNKRTNALEQEFITKTLGQIGDESVIPMLMEIANNDQLPLEIRSNAVEILSKKQADELVTFLNEMLGDPHSRNKVNEFALNAMGDLSEERMIMALLESYKMGKTKYYSLLNSIMNSLSDFNNPEIVSIYNEIANSKDFPSKIRLKAFKSLIRFSDTPGTIDRIIELLDDPNNYKYYEEIISLLQNTGAYEKHKNKLRMAAFNAMQIDTMPSNINNE